MGRFFRGVVAQVGAGNRQRRVPGEVAGQLAQRGPGAPQRFRSPRQHMVHPVRVVDAVGNACTAAGNGGLTRVKLEFDTETSPA